MTQKWRKENFLPHWDLNCSTLEPKPSVLPMSYIDTNQNIISWHSPWHSCFNYFFHSRFWKFGSFNNWWYFHAHSKKIYDDPVLASKKVWKITYIRCKFNLCDFTLECFFQGEVRFSQEELSERLFLAGVLCLCLLLSYQQDGIKLWEFWYCLCS